MADDNRLDLKTMGQYKIRLDNRMNRLESGGDRVLILDGVQFCVVRPTNNEILSNHLPEGLYVNANDIVEYIKRNLFGHDKEKYGIGK